MEECCVEQSATALNRKFSSHLSPNCPPLLVSIFSTMMLTHLRLPVTASILPWQFFPHTMALLSRAAVTSSVQFQHVPAGEDKEESCLQHEPALLTISPLSRLWCGAADYTSVTPHLVCDTSMVSSSTAVRSSSTPLTQPRLWLIRTHKTSKHPRSSLLPSGGKQTLHWTLIHILIKVLQPLMYCTWYSLLTCDIIYFVFDFFLQDISILLWGRGIWHNHSGWLIQPENKYLYEYIQYIYCSKT